MAIQLDQYHIAILEFVEHRGETHFDDIFCELSQHMHDSILGKSLGYLLTKGLLYKEETSGMRVHLSGTGRNQLKQLRHKLQQNGYEHGLEGGEESLLAESERLRSEAIINRQREEISRLKERNMELKNDLFYLTVFFFVLGVLLCLLMTNWPWLRQWLSAFRL